MKKFKNVYGKTNYYIAKIRDVIEKAKDNGCSVHFFENENEIGLEIAGKNEKSVISESRTKQASIEKVTE